MLLNFCHHSLKPLIKCDKVSFDGYEISNLVAPDQETRQKGFLSDHFIKPPVNITIQFPCNIVIYRIIINPVIGQQKSCELKVFTATQNIVDSWLYGREQTEVKTDGVMFHFVGSVHQVEPTVVCFENALFRNKGSEIEDNRVFPCMASLNGRKTGSLTNVSHVTICVQRTYSGKAAAIRSLEIWGVPTGKVPRSLQCKLRTVYNQSCRQTTNMVNKRNRDETEFNDIKNTESSEVNTKNLAQVSDTMIENGVEIPEDFIDQITYEIMAMPVVLPSGKVIDQSTLDKFVNTEASWGRSPSDPFTGLAFTQGSHPVANAALKARIDKFVLEHSDLLNVPRTLGHSSEGGRHSQQENQFKTSRLLSRDCDKHLEISDLKKSSVQTCKSETVDVGASQCATLPISPSVVKPQCQHLMLTDMQRNPIPKLFPVKRKYDHSMSSLMTSKPMKRSCMFSSSVTDVTVTTCTQKSFKSEKYYGQYKDTKAVVKNHTVNLSQSLDSALSSVLVGLPSFTRNNSSSKLSVQSKSAIKQDASNNCSKCKVSLEDTTLVKYKLPCEHMICRKCVTLTSGQMVCEICNRTCNGSQLVRAF